MAPDTVLTLGDFAFSRAEVPEKIAIGGSQHLVQHDLVGGARIVDAMGRNDVPLEWSGLFLGSSALDRARYLDRLRVVGNPLELIWDQLAYTVVIDSFTADFERYYQLPYRIRCVVVQDRTSPVTAIVSAGIDDAISGDMATVDGLGSLIGDGPLSTAIGALDTAIKAVSSFATATQGMINSVLVPLAAVQSRVGTLIASVGNTVSNIGTLGGILPNSPIAQSVAKLNSQVASMTQLPNLYNLNNVLGRIGGNLGSVQQAGSSLITAGGNLMKIAGQAYGDATAWPTIAKANKLIDPVLTGVQTLTIPTAPGSTGGIMAP